MCSKPRCRTPNRLKAAETLLNLAPAPSFLAPTDPAKIVHEIVENRRGAIRTSTDDLMGTASEKPPYDKMVVAVWAELTSQRRISVGNSSGAF